MNSNEPRYSAEEAVMLASRFSKVMSWYEAATEMIVMRLENLSSDFRLTGQRDPIDSIQSRLKSPQSIIDKLARLHIPFTIENMRHELTDIAGVRVICHFRMDVYKVAELISRQQGLKVVALKDYIKHPKDNGYRSLHMIVTTDVQLTSHIHTVPVEIQLRTSAMNCWASCEHQLHYKKDNDLSDDAKAKLRRFADTMNEMDEMMQGLADELIPR